MKGGSGGAVVRLLGAAALWWAAAGCSGPGNDYSEYRFLPGEQWAYGDTLHFVPVHPDSVVAARVVVALRHDDGYPFTGADIELTVGRLRDTLRLQLCDTTGRWLGHGIGTNFQVADTLGCRIVHPSGLPVTLRQVMRCDTLCGLDRVGLFLLAE